MMIDARLWPQAVWGMPNGGTLGELKPLKSAVLAFGKDGPPVQICSRLEDFYVLGA
jgi:hypothetical protein